MTQPAWEAAWVCVSCEVEWRPYRVDGQLVGLGCWLCGERGESKADRWMRAAQEARRSRREPNWHYP